MTSSTEAPPTMTAPATLAPRSDVPAPGGAALRLSLRVPPANDAEAPPERRALLRRLSRAVERRLVCVIRYASEPGGAPATRAIEPLAVTASRGSFGVLAWCRLRADLRTFRMDRIEALAVSTDHFEQHPGLALERFIQHRRRELP